MTYLCCYLIVGLLMVLALLHDPELDEGFQGMHACEKILFVLSISVLWIALFIAAVIKIVTSRSN